MIKAALKVRFGRDLGAHLGRGGEADVYAIADDRVLRLCKPDASQAGFDARLDLLERMDGACGGVCVPRVLEHGRVEGQLFTIETRLGGVPMSQALGAATDRRALVRDYMEVAARLGEGQEARPFGEIGREDPIRADRLRDYMERRVKASMAAGGVGLDGEALAAPFEEPEQPGIVHLDYFPGNVMADGNRVTGVLDFGYSTIVGDPRFTPVLAAIYLSNRISPPAGAEDRAIAMEWLAERNLTSLVVPLRRWIAAYWSFCREDDPKLAAEIRHVLGV